MADGRIKKLYLVYILEILKNYSDCDHRLLQKDIIDYLRREYGVDCERKAISRNIGNLQDLGYEIEYDNGYYLAARAFEDSELRLLIDSVLASRHIPKKQAKDLIGKLANQSNVYFKNQVRHVYNIDSMDHDNGNELFYAIDVICEAIEKKRQIRFYYNKYGPDKKLYHTTKERHLVNPYQIVVANGKYYLIGNVDKYDNVTHFRIERISRISIEESPAKAASAVTELKSGLNLPRHMLEHIYMFSGPSVCVSLRVSRSALSDTIDWLGREIEIGPEKAESEESFIVRARVNENAIKYWALQFGQGVEVLEPPTLREQIKNIIKEMAKKYEK